MSYMFIPTRFQWRQDTAANWTANNPIPLQGEPCLETDTGMWKLGDGVTRYNSLVYRESGGGGAVTHLATASVSGAAATSMTISGLNLVADRAYLIHLSVGNPTGSSSALSLFYNGDAVASNYWRQYLQGNSTAVSAGRDNHAQIGNLAAGERLNATILIRADVDGLPRANVTVNRGATSSAPALLLQLYAHYRNSTDNVTSITLSGAVASSLGVGSYMRLYKVSE